MTTTTTPLATTTTTPVGTTTITPTPGKTTTATPTSTGPTSTPTAVAAVGLWVENAIANNVTEFKGTTLTTPGVSVPTAAVTNKSADFVDPAGVTFDSSNNQWVSVCGSTATNGTITKFDFTAVQKLATTPAPAANVVLSDDGSGKLVSCPWTMTFDTSNDLWVANSNQLVGAGPGFVTDYAPAQLATSGHPTPDKTLTDPTQFVSPTGVVFDSTGDLFVADFGPGQFGTAVKSAVWVFKAATIAALTPGTNIKVADAKLSDSTTLTPVNGALDPKSGDLWVADCEANGTGEIYKFAAAVLTTGATSATTVFQSTSISTPNGTEDTIDCPGGIAFDASGNLWYTNFSSNKVDGAVGEFTATQLSTAPAGKSTPTPNIFLDGMPGGANFDGPIGLTFGPQV